MTSLQNVVEAPMHELLERVGLAEKADSDPAHEIGFAREVGDKLVFMDGGVVVEAGHPRELLANPQHERTQAFLSAVL